MSARFASVPQDRNTRVYSRRETTIGEYGVLHECSNWDGIDAESIIFANEDIDGLSDSEIQAIVKGSRFIGDNSNTTLSRSDSRFTFVSFNFAHQD